MAFRKDFLWGAATAAYQVEGAAFEDGRGPSVWDTFSHRTGAVWSGQTGDEACDHYHRYKEDVALMKRLGLKTYRFSIAWPRVMPDGAGAVNEKGLAFYDRLVDELLAAGIEPCLTLFHWDYPQALQNRGGWLNRDSAEWFADYTQVVIRRLGDRVRFWMTQNEIQCFIGFGHSDGIMAPGIKLDWPQVLLAGHNALRAHGRSVQVIRAEAKAPPQVGWAPVGVVYSPLTDTPADIAATRKATFSVPSKYFWNNAWWMDPVHLGRYPADGVKLYGPDMPHIHAGDMELIRQPLDYFGVNIYSCQIIRAGKGGKGEVVPHAWGHDMTAFKWAVTPQCLYWGPKFFQERYKLPIYVTENGLSNADWVSLDGKVHDPQRIDFYRRYLRELRRCADEGVDIRGFFAWSAMDNFEWSNGYKERFGLVYVDYPTQRRIPKDSALWYKQVIAANGAKL